MANAETDLFHAAQGLDALAETPGTDTPSGPHTLTWRTWTDTAHQHIDILWHTFANTHLARTGTLQGLSLTNDGHPTGILVLLEPAGKPDTQERAIPANRITCLRTHNGDVLLGPDHTHALDLALLLDNATRWLHSKAKDTVVQKHAKAFTTLAERLHADDQLQKEALDQAVDTAEDHTTANTRRNAVG
jgi:hypothetical protein